MARKKRTITSEEKAMFLALKPDDITQTLFDSLFADTVDTKSIGDNTKTPKIIPSKFNTFDEMELTTKDYFVKETLVTNGGLFIFNKIGRAHV